MHESTPAHRHVMKELLDTERVYVEELLCVLEVRVVSSYNSPAEPARSWKPVSCPFSDQGMWTQSQLHWEVFAGRGRGYSLGMAEGLLGAGTLCPRVWAVVTRVRAQR